MHKFNPIKQIIVWAVSYNSWHTSIVIYAKIDWNPDCTCLQRGRNPKSFNAEKQMLGGFFFLVSTGFILAVNF